MKKILIATLACVLSLQINAQPVLKFQKDKPFRILQLTDLHYIHGDDRAKEAISNVNELISVEKPDVIVVTGDLVYGKPGYESMKDILDAIASHKIPFAITYGNHDDEQGLSRSELLEIAKTYPNNLTSTTEGITGVTNYALPILSSDGKAPSQVLYIFDSNSYINVEGVKGKYDFIHIDQIEWYMNLSRSYAEANGGKALPALAFFHIPLPEYNQALRSGADFIGTKREPGGESKLNSGLFAASKMMGDIRCFFVGHDHNDDYITILYGTALAYGRYSGCNTVYNDVQPKGGRIIELTEGQTPFRTYIRLIGDSVINDVIVPKCF